MKNFQKRFTPTAVLLLVVLLLAGGFWYFKKGNRFESSYQTSNLSTTPSPVSNREWKSYKNTGVGIQFSYPNEWHLSESYRYPNGIQGQTLLVLQISNGAAENLSGSLLVNILEQKQSSKLGLEGFVKENGFPFVAPQHSTIESKKTVQIAGQDAIDYTFLVTYPSENIKESLVRYITTKDSQNRFWTIELDYPRQEKLDANTSLDQILSTLRFTN